MSRVSATKEDIARRRNRNWVLIFAVCLFIGGIRAVSLKPPLAGPFSVTPTQRSTPLIIAHRGGASVRPENTMLAFQHAAELDVDLLELDVRLSADGVPVVIHDAAVDRTTDGTGLVAAQTLAELRALDAAATWPAYAGRGVRVPTLLAVLQRFADQRFVIELKDDEENAAEVVCATLEQSGIAPQVIVATAHHAVMRAFRRRCPEVTTSATPREAFWFVLAHHLRLGRWYESGNQILQLPADSKFYDVRSSKLYASAARTGRAVQLWTVNEPDALEAVLRAGAAGVMTDFPDRALAARARLLSAAVDQ